MVIPPFRGVKAVFDTPGLGDAKGFIPVKPTYEHLDRPGVFAAGVAVQVQTPWQTPIATGVPKTGFPAEVMAKIAVHNIAAEMRGEQPKEGKEFGKIPAVCVMDAGNMGVMILGDAMLPPRKHELLIPGPQAHWAKLAFEKYFLWKMRHGYVGMP
jgi:sulfide:quinone oxidoreductase